MTERKPQSYLSRSTEADGLIVEEGYCTQESGDLGDLRYISHSVSSLNIEI